MRVLTRRFAMMIGKRIKNLTATTATLLLAGAAAAQVETYQGTQIIREDGFANFNSLKYPDPLLGYTEGGLVVSINNVEFEFVPIDGTPSWYPNGGSSELAIITRADGAPFEALEFQVWNGWGLDPSWVWASAYLGGELQAQFDIDQGGPSQGFPVLGFKGRFDELRIGAYFTADDRNAHDPAGYNAIAMDNMRFGAAEGNSCYADLNGDNVLDLFDFLEFTNLFNAGDDTADCEDDGVLDLFDFLCYTNAFNAGC
jgi:hypothetical protein